MMRSDWAEVELDLVCEKAQKVKRKEMPPTDTFLYLDIGGLNNQTNRITSHKIYTWEQAPSRAQQLVKVGDVLFSTVRTYLKNIAPVTDKKYEGQICSSGFTVIRGKGKLLESRYALYLSLYEDFLHPLNELQTGTSYPAVRDSDVFAQVIPLAPFPEQRAIAAKIDQLFSRLDYSIASFKAAQEKLALYRQAVLKKAFEGELTRKWSEQQTSLSGWARKKVSELGHILTGSTPSKKNTDFYSSKDYPFYKPADLDAGERVKGSIDSLSKSGFQACRSVPAYSVLVTCIGATIGKTGLVIREGGFNQQINAILPSKEMNPKFVYYQATGMDFQNAIKNSASSTTLPILNKGKFSNLEMVVCPLIEQDQVVAEIETRFSVCDHLQHEIERGLQKAEALRQSVLKKAFEGRLLTESELADCRAMPDWEPAQQLLARIQTEKCAKQNTGKSPATDKTIVNKY